MARLELELRFIPASKKNNTVIKRPLRGKPFIGPNARVKAEEITIAGLAWAQMLQDRIREIPLSHDVALDVVHVIAKKAGGDRCIITVRDLGEPPKRARTGRVRDAINTIALIADALQKVAYRDDKQIMVQTLRVEYE